MKTSSCNRD